MNLALLLLEANDDTLLYVLIGIVALFLLWLAIYLYFLPAIIAKKRGHRNYEGILILTIFFGWSMLGWVGALIWALWHDKPATQLTT